MATDDARAAWKEACASPDEEHTRAAFRQCVLAARIVRRAADALSDGDERRGMVRDAGRIEAAADELNALLARIVEDGQPEGARPLAPDVVKRAVAAIDRLLGRR